MTRRIKTLFTLTLVAILLSAQARLVAASSAHPQTSKESEAAQITATSRMKPMAVSGRLLVKYKSGVSKSRQRSLVKAVAARSDREISNLGVHVIDLQDGADKEVFAKVLRGQAEVQFVESDYLCYPAEMMVPDDPLYASQWHLPAISCPQAWGMSTGSDQVTIAICDTGVEATHPDLASKLVPGWNVVDGNSDTSPVASHGTETAGTAAATGNNSLGVASPALNCKIMPVRVTSRADGAALISDMAAGVTWAADHGARVASVSYMGADSDMMAAAGDYIQSMGGVLVMASGNTGTYDAVADSSSIIVVGATTSTDTVAAFSTTGALVDLAAPGLNVLTTSPGGSYQNVSGTSFSAPLVAGAVGLLLSLNPTLTPAQIDTILKVSADDFGSQGWDPSFGWGRLNVGKAATIVEGMMTGADDTNPPAAGFLHPQIGGDINGLIGVSHGELVEVNALDDRAISEVKLLADGALVSTATAAPYKFSWDTSSFVDGSQHTLTAIAKDETGNVRTVSTSVTVSASFDITPPTLSFIDPVATDGVVSLARSGAAQIQLDSQDGTAVSYVRLIGDGALLGTVDTSPYIFSWDTSSFDVGSAHTLIAITADPAGNWAVLTVTANIASDADTIAPEVSFAQPLDGAQVSRSQAESISIDATDNIDVTEVNLYVDNVMIGTDTSAPYNFQWNTSSLVAGSQHVLRAVAWDASENSSQTSITVTIKNVVPDTTAPTVSFQAPLAGSQVVKSQGESVRINAADNQAVASVSLYVDNSLLGTSQTAPYGFTWNTSGLNAGSRHSLRAVATDQAGNSASATINVTVVNPPPDRTAPSVSFVTPQAAETVAKSQSTPVSISASDNVGVASVSLYSDGDLVSTTTSAPYNFAWNTSSFAEGSRHTLRAVAVDAAGNTTRVSINVTVRTVDTTAPVVSFVSPGDGEQLHGNETIEIDATDNVEVTKVDLLIDGVLFKTWTGNNYTVRWNTKQATLGAHRLTCVAYDYAGNTATASITVSVR